MAQGLSLRFSLLILFATFTVSSLSSSFAFADTETVNVSNRHWVAIGGSERVVGILRDLNIKDLASKRADALCKSLNPDFLKATYFKATIQEDSQASLFGVTHRPFSISIKNNTYWIHPYIFETITCEKPDKQKEPDYSNFFSYLEKIQSLSTMTPPQSCELPKATFPAQPIQPIPKQIKPVSQPIIKTPSSIVRAPSKTPSKTPKNSPLGEIQTATVNLNQYPDMINQHGKTAEVTIGDIHGNTMKFIYFLIREGVLELSPPKDAITIFKKLTDIYNGPQPPTPEDLKYFEQSLERMKVLTNAPKVRLIGDELADRGKNDLLTLLVMEKLQNAGKPPEIIFSNHSLGFMKVYEEHMIKGFNGPINSGINVADTNSLKGMFDTLEQYPEMKNRVLDIVKNAYLPHLKIMSYSANPSNQGMAPYSHAPVGLEAVDKLKEKYSPNCQDYKNNSVALTDCIDKINRLFRQSILSAGFFSEVTTNPNDAVRYVVWNRNYEGLERPEVLKDGTRMSYIHGHDSREKNDSKSPSHVICLDNTLGKGKRSSNIGEYSIYATGSNKTSQAVNFPNHQLSSLGFINLGNTCFANAAHNSILAHPALDTYLAATSHDYSSVVPPAQFNTPEQQAQWHLTKAFRDLALDYRKAQSQKVNTGNFEPQLKNLFSRLKAYLRITSPESEFINGIPGEQMDSEEYFTLLTDKVGLSRYLSPLRIASQIEFTGSGGVKNKPKQDPAGNAIQAPINGASTVAEALQNYLSPEILDKSEWVNHPKTGQPAPSQKTSYLTVGQDGKFPDHLTINLKRFESEVKVKNGQATVETKKLKNRVKITEKLDVPYYDGSLKQYACKRMVPSSVVVHTGNTAHSGHYYAYVYHAKDNTWFERNDSVVKKLNPLEVQTAKNVMSENAYYMTYVTDPSGSKCSK